MIPLKVEITMQYEKVALLEDILDIMGNLQKVVEFSRTSNQNSAKSIKLLQERINLV